MEKHYPKFDDDEFRDRCGLALAMIMAMLAFFWFGVGIVVGYVWAR